VYHFTTKFNNKIKIILLESNKLELTLISILKYYGFNFDKIKIKIIMSLLRKYEIMILLTEEFNDSELKLWIFNYAKNLRKFSVCDISVISRGKHNLAYSIHNRRKGNYIQLNFSSMPKYINNFSNILKMDLNVLRFLVFNK